VFSLDGVDGKDVGRGFINLMDEIMEEVKDIYPPMTIVMVNEFLDQSIPEL
jgi:hypothetical protein